MKTTLKLDPETTMMVITPVFTCSISPGEHSEQGGIGEHIYQILGRWISANFPNLSVLYVQQTSMTTWAAVLGDKRFVEFSIII